MTKTKIGKVVYPEWITTAQEQLNKKNYALFLQILGDVIVYGEIPSTYDQDTKAYKLFNSLKILPNMKAKMNKYETKLKRNRNENNSQNVDNEDGDLGKYRNVEIMEINEMMEMKENTNNQGELENNVTPNTNTNTNTNVNANAKANTDTIGDLDSDNRVQIIKPLDWMLEDLPKPNNSDIIGAICLYAINANKHLEKEQQTKYAYKVKNHQYWYINDLFTNYAPIIQNTGIDKTLEDAENRAYRIWCKYCPNFI